MSPSSPYATDTLSGEFTSIHDLLAAATREVQKNILRHVGKLILAYIWQYLIFFDVLELSPTDNTGATTNNYEFKSQFIPKDVCFVMAAPPGGAGGSIPLGDGTGDDASTIGPAEVSYKDIRFPIRKIPKEPEEYMTWRYGVQATFFSLSPTLEAAEDYWNGLKEYKRGTLPWAGLKDNVPSDLVKLDVKMFAAMITCLDGKLGAVLNAKIQAKVRFGSGRQALIVLDEYFGKEAEVLAKKAFQELMNLRLAGIDDMDRFVTRLQTLTLRIKDAGNNIYVSQW